MWVLVPLLLFCCGVGGGLETVQSLSLTVCKMTDQFSHASGDSSAGEELLPDCREDENHKAMWSIS